MALHARTAKRQGILDAGVQRQLPLRVILFVLAFVPSAAMVALLVVNAAQYYDDWHTATDRENSVVSSNGAVPTTGLFYDLQQERQLTAATLADPTDYTSKLAQVRKLTDASATALESLSGVTAPSVTAGLQQFETLLRQLPAYRAAVDDGTATQGQAYDDYTNMISSDLTLFNDLTKTGVNDIDAISAPSIPQGWAQEMISREDALITAGAVSGHLTGAQRAEIDQASGAEQFAYEYQVIPAFPQQVADDYRALLNSPAWQEKLQVEQTLDNSPESSSGQIDVSVTLGQQWQQVTTALDPQLQHLTLVETGYIVTAANAEISSLKTRLITQTLLGGIGVLLVLGFTFWLTRVLRRRIYALRLAAEDLETRLPDVVERLRRGEAVDVDAELPELHYGQDELGMLGRALNAARASALETSIRQVEQYRGFERLLQRIARRTQLLIGLQMKRLSEMERQHEDATILEGLFDLDHLTARLRRYEENLVILGGGQTQRRWRKPVPLLNVLRSAQGEVQDYRRIRIETGSRVWISERAVGALVHVLAELMENAVAFSRPPTPVEVTAAPVARGLAIEIEDRGMGLDPEQYARANALMADPPRMDVLSRADDARLGLYVVARLAANLGVKVELRPSSYGGTRVVVLVPNELVLTEDQVPAPAENEEDFDPAPRLAPVPGTGTGSGFGNGSGLGSGSGPIADFDAAPLSVLSAGPRGSVENFGRPDRSDRLGRTERPDRTDQADGPERLDRLDRPDLFPAGVGIGARTPDPAAAQSPATSPEPLPKRVRQVSLVAELRESRGGADDPAPDEDVTAALRAAEPGRSGATVGAFQRQSRLARLAADEDPDPAPPGEPPLGRPSPDAEQIREEDGR